MRQINIYYLPLQLFHSWLRQNPRHSPTGSYHRPTDQQCRQRFPPIVIKIMLMFDFENNLTVKKLIKQVLWQTKLPNVLP